MTKIEARKVLERFEAEWLMEHTSREVADAIRVAITALERCEVMDALDRPDAILCLCGGHMVKDKKCVLRVHPPMYRYVCADCGRVEIK
jgi:hypothetical protein